MSKLARPGFSRLKTPAYSKNRQSSSVIVTPSSGDGTEASQAPSDTTSQQIPVGVATQQVRPSVKKSANVPGQPKLAKPVSGLASKNSKPSSKIATTRNVQHGTGPYERAKEPSSAIPYVGKKRPAGVLKSPDSRATGVTKPYLTNGTAKHNETVMTEVTRDKGIPAPKFAENGATALPRALKRTSLPVGGKSQDVPRTDTSRRQTISTPTKSKVSFPKHSAAVRPRSSCATDDKKEDSKKNMSKSLQCLPKAIPDCGTPLNKPLNKREMAQKSVSHDDILNCSKKELRKPVAGIAPRSKSGFPSSKFGFSRSAVEKPRASSTNSATNTVSTPQSHLVNTFDHQLSPIIGTPASGKTLEHTFNKVSEFPPSNDTFNKTSEHSFNKASEPHPSNATCNIEPSEIGSPTVNKTEEINIGMNNNSILNTVESCDEANDTKQINIIINLDTVGNSAGVNTTTTLSSNDVGFSESLSSKQTLNNNETFSKSSTFVKDDEDLYSNTAACEMNNKTFNKTIPSNSSRSDILSEKHDSDCWDEQNPILNATAILDKTCEDLSPIERTYEVGKNRTFDIDKSCDEDENVIAKSYETNDRTFNKSKSLETGGGNPVLNTTKTIEEKRTEENFNETKIYPNFESLDKSDSGFDDTNFLNISDVPASVCELSPLSDSKSAYVGTSGTRVDGDLSEDVLKVIAAISSNINRSCSTNTFSQSPIKGATGLMPPQKSDFMYHLSKDLTLNNTNWLDDSVCMNGPALEDTMPMSQTMSLSHELDEYNCRYESDDLISKSTTIDVSEVTSTDSAGSNGTLLEGNAAVFEDIIQTPQAPSLLQELEEYNSKYETDDLISKSTTIDISEVTSSKQFDDVSRHDSDNGSRNTDISQSTDKYRNHLSSIGTDSDGVEDIDILPVKVSSVELSDYLNDCYCEPTMGGNSHFTGLDAIHNSLKLKTHNIGSEMHDGTVLCDSGHCTDMNDNEVNIIDGAKKLTINDIRTDLFTCDDYTDGVDKIFSPSSQKTSLTTPPNEPSSSVSSDTCPSTPLSRQESLEYDFSRKCHTIATTRRVKKVGRSSTYSSSELITKFRIPREPKCFETSDGDILMDKTTFLHFMNEVKVVKTSLLKLKRTLVEAPCASPLVRTPIKRSSSAVEASAVPPLSPRTCQCSPMAVVNPLVLKSGSISSPSKDKEIYASEEEKLQDFASTIKILQSQLANCEIKQQEIIEENLLLRSLQENSEQKQQDILEENILLREEISHLTERLRKARICESGTSEHESIADIDELSADLDSRLPILQRMYSSDGQ